MEMVLDIPFWLELVATIFCAIGGAMAAVRAHYDIFGVTCLAIISGLAGGMVRDLFLQNYGIYAFQQPSLIVAAAIMGLVVFYLGKLVTYFDPITDFVECLATALFVVLGTNKALLAGQEFVPAIILGLMTAIGGGIVRDICMARPPQTFQAGPLYTTAALIGAILFATMKQIPYVEQYAAITGVISVIVIRYAALVFNWQTVTARDQSGRIARIVTMPVVKAVQAARPPKGKLAREKSLSTYGKIAARLQTWVAKLESDEITTNGPQTTTTPSALYAASSAVVKKIRAKAAPKPTASGTTTAHPANPGSMASVAPDHCEDCCKDTRIRVQESDRIIVSRKEFQEYLECAYVRRGRRTHPR